MLSGLRARYGIRAKVVGEAARVALNRTPAAEVERWCAAHRFFFILSMGRSGTQFLARLLAQAPGAIVEHEPVFSDIAAQRRAFADPQAAHDYVARFRKPEMYLRLHSRPFQVYGEANSLLRRHAAALPHAFPHAPILHLVRDGRDVVRSLMSRPTLMPGHTYTGWVRPLPADPYAPQWDTMSRFEKVCWYWQEENRALRAQVGRRVHFEGLLADYGYFAGELLEPLGLALAEAVWQSAVQRPANETRRFQMPPWREWDAATTATFWRICGDEMCACGYAPDGGQKGDAHVG